MGYYVHHNVTKGSFRIRQPNVAKAARAIKEWLAEVGHSQWITPDYLKESRTLYQVMRHWGWEPTFDQEGNVISIDWEAEKGGDDHRFFNAMAPYVEDGCFIQMWGEDGDHWKYVFKNGKCKLVKARVVWPDGEVENFDD